MTDGIDRGFWTGRRVFLTGHTGFMGGWLATWLVRLGARVAGFSLPPPTDPSFFEATRLGPRLVSTEGDVRDHEALASALVGSRAEVAFHLAAQPLVRMALADPIGTFAINVMGTVHVLDAARKCPALKSVVVVTSDKVYENREWVWGYREDDRLGGRELYGASKAAAEHVVDSYRHGPLADRGVASVRAGNVIGGGDWAADRLIPDAISAFAAGRVLKLRKPSAIRPWQHVLEPANGMLRLAQQLAVTPAAGGAWNLGPPEDESWTVEQVVSRIAEMWGGHPRWAEEADDGYEARRLAVSSAKARSGLGWRPVWSTDKALAMTMDWYKAHRDGWDMASVTLAQVEAYESDDRDRGRR